MKSSWVFRCGGLAFLTALVGCRTADAPVATAVGFEGTVRSFSLARHKLEGELSQRLNLAIPAGVDSFFEAAETGDWLSVSNKFETFVRSESYGTAVPELRNELWAPIHEVQGLYEVWVGWKRDSSLVGMFCGPVLASMPRGAVYFGGTDYGRFLITAVNAVKKQPDVFCITQNALADMTYAAHLRAIYEHEMWLPQVEDSAHAFQRYVEEVRSGKRPANAELKIENGRVQVSGALGVMEINGILCEMIFEHNKDAHEFFVEESYVLNWMYPYLEPHGLIMKLNPKPLDKLSEQGVARDREFWSGYVTQLEGHSGYAGNFEARKAFSKLRSAIAGLYAYRKMNTEAEAAFRQALRLCPVSPEASFRLAKLYEEQGRTADAVQVMDAYLKLDPPYSRDEAVEYGKRLKKMETRGPDVKDN